MEKKLPKVFANTIDKDLNNNERCYYSSSDRVDANNNKEEVKFQDSDMNINQKINSIFNSPKYIYKADVNIKTKSGTLKKRIVGRNSTHLITIENELIPITDVLDIAFSE